MRRYTHQWVQRQRLMGLRGNADWRPAPFPGKQPVRMAYMIQRVAGGSLRYVGKLSRSRIQTFTRLQSKAGVLASWFALFDRKGLILWGSYDGPYPLTHTYRVGASTSRAMAYYFFGVETPNFFITEKFYFKRVQGHAVYSSFVKNPLKKLDEYRRMLQAWGWN